MAWQPGTSGNPSGRPKADGKLRDRLREAAPELLEQLIERARAGDPVAVKVFWERTLPALRNEAARVELSLPAQATLLQRADAVLKLAESGEISIDVASDYISNVTKLVAVEQAGELKAQLQMLLEERYGGIA